VGVIVTPLVHERDGIADDSRLEVWVSGNTVRLALPSGEYDFMVTEIAGRGPGRQLLALFDDDGIHRSRGGSNSRRRPVAEALFTPEEPPAPKPAPVVSRRSLLTVRRLSPPRVWPMAEGSQSRVKTKKGLRSALHCAGALSISIRKNNLLDQQRDSDRSWSAASCSQHARLGRVELAGSDRSLFRRR
jgi:hypothetical protein